MTGINNNYWFEPLSVRDLSNLKITSEINYVRLISPGLRSVYKREYYMDEAFFLPSFPLSRSGSHVYTTRDTHSLLFSFFPSSRLSSSPLDFFADDRPFLERGSRAMQRLFFG